MRRLAWIAAGLVGALVLALVVALLLFDAEQLRAPIRSVAEDALGRGFEFGELDLALLPMPALRMRDIRIEGPSSDDPPFAEVEELRLRVAVLPLLTGNVVLRSLELQSPRVRIPLDAEGRPVLPAPAERGADEGGAPEAGAAEPGGAASGDAPSATAPTLAVQRIVVSNASLEAGPWRVERAGLSGVLHLDGSAELELAAELPGLGSIHDAQIALGGLGGAAPDLEGSARIELDLGGLAERLALEGELAGRASGEVTFGLVGGELVAARADFALDDLRVRVDELSLDGDGRVSGALGERFSVDLEGAELSVAGQLHKPAGQVLKLEGTLGREPGPAALGDVRLTLGTNRVDLSVDLAGDTPRVQIEPSSLDLAALRPFLSDDLPELGGTLRIDSLGVWTEPLSLTGSAALAGVSARLQHGTVSLSGDLVAHGSRLRLRDGELLVAEQAARVSGSYDLAAGTVELDVDLEGDDLGAILTALRGKAEVAGVLDARVSLRGRPHLSGLAGAGSFAITQGKLYGFSLLREVLGELVEVGRLVAQLKGKDLSRLEEEDFELLSADFRIAGGFLESENLTLVYENATAYLRGRIGLRDGALELSGRVELSEEVEQELGGSVDGRKTVIPIAGIGGTVARPRVRLDRRALAQVALELGSGGRLRERLEEKIGKDGADAVQDLLRDILGGRKK